MPLDPQSLDELRIARTPDDIHAIRVSAGKADLVLGCDLVVSGAQKVLAAVRQKRFLHVSGSEFNRPSPRIGLAIRELRAALDSVRR